MFFKRNPSTANLQLFLAGVILYLIVSSKLEEAQKGSKLLTWAHQGSLGLTGITVTHFFHCKNQLLKGSKGLKSAHLSSVELSGARCPAFFFLCKKKVSFLKTQLYKNFKKVSSKCLGAFSDFKTRGGSKELTGAHQDSLGLTGLTGDQCRTFFFSVQKLAS